MDRPGTHLNPQANVHSDPIVRSSTSSLSGEVVAEEANTRMREVSSAPSIFWHESEQGDQLHQRAVRYILLKVIDRTMDPRTGLSDKINFSLRLNGGMRLLVTPKFKAV